MITIRRSVQEDDAAVVDLISSIMDSEFHDAKHAYPTEDVECIEKAYGGIGEAFAQQVDLVQPPQAPPFPRDRQADQAEPQSRDGQGDPASVFIFRAASTLVTGVSSTVKLINGARACNVYWQLGSAATLGTNSKMSGHVIAQSSISTGAGTSVAGQLIAISGSVTLGGTTIANNGCLPTPNILTPSTAPVQTSDVIAYAPVAGLIAGGEIVSVEVAEIESKVVSDTEA